MDMPNFIRLLARRQLACGSRCAVPITRRQPAKAVGYSLPTGRDNTESFSCAASMRSNGDAFEGRGWRRPTHTTRGSGPQLHQS